MRTTPLRIGMTSPRDAAHEGPLRRPPGLRRLDGVVRRSRARLRSGSVEGAVAAILDAAKWLVPQPPCRIHRRSNVAHAVIGPAQGGPAPHSRTRSAPMAGE